MEEIGSFEAKTHFSRLIREVTAGKTFVITKNGEPVAQLCPLAGAPGLTPEAAAGRLRSRKVQLGMSIRKALAEGRR